MSGGHVIIQQVSDDSPPNSTAVGANNARVTFHSDTFQVPPTQLAHSLISDQYIWVEYATRPGASWSFNFTGNWVQAHGFLTPQPIAVENPASAHFSVDGLHGESVTVLPVSNASDLGPTRFPGVKYYTVTADQLAVGDHTITINVTSATEDLPFYLERIIWATVTNATLISAEATSFTLPNTWLSTSIDPSSSTLVPTSSQPGAPGGMTTPAFPGSSPDTPTSTSQAGTSSSFPLAPVIGAIAGGLVLLAAFVGLLLYLRKRFRTPRVSEVDDKRPDLPESEGPGFDESEGLGQVVRPVVPGDPSWLHALPGGRNTPIQSSISSSEPATQFTAMDKYTSTPSTMKQQPWAGWEDSAAPYLSPFRRPSSSIPDMAMQSVYSTSTSWDQRSGPVPQRGSTESSALQFGSQRSTWAMSGELGSIPGTPRGASAAAPSTVHTVISKADCVTGSPPSSSSRILGGLVEYDGKESRLMAVPVPHDTSLPSSTESPSSDPDQCRAGIPPPAYEP
ncbi:hypothetical protein OH77DRAFT_1438813 [Trametes cingulata]|nr:hypothetical protein OH77DRAFT_1438813 [Trametes cingulata]